MKRLAVFVVGVVGTLGAGVAVGGRPSVSDPLAELLACNDSAVGGGALRRAVAVHYGLQITEPKFTVTGRYTATRAGTARVDVFAGGERVFSEWWDGTAGWQLGRGATDSTPTSADGAAALRHGVEQPGHLWTLADMPRNGHTVALAGHETIDGTDYDVVKLTLRDGFENWYWVNTASCLVERNRNFRAYHPDLDPHQRWTESVFRDFAQLHGITKARLTLNIDMATGDTVGRTVIREFTIGSREP